MKKSLVILGGGILVLALAVYVGLTFFLGSIVKAGVNQVGPKLTQTQVELKGATLSPLTGSGTLTGLLVGNPAGWNSDRAFYLGRIHVDLEPFSIFGDHVVINEIVIDQPEFVYETRLVTSNIRQLLENIEQSTGGKKDEAAKKDGGSGVKFVVKKFRITNAKATLGVGPTAVPVPLPPINLDNLGVAEGGITGDQVAGAVMKQVLANIVTSTAQVLGKAGSATGAAAAGAAKDAAKKAGEGIKKLFGGG